MPSSHRCNHRRLVLGESCQVQQCSNGTIHVVLSGVTLRFTASDFVDLATALGVAANRLDPARGVGASATRLLC